MPGYVLVQQQSLSPPLQEGRGIKANTRKIGLLDFLRELKDENFPYDENSSLLITGLEDALLESRPNVEERARTIRGILQKAGREFSNRGCADVQFVIRQPLKRGEKLTIEHVTMQLPIYLIFGSPPPESINGQLLYRASFNLSSAV
jgi:hypothetical protein